MTEYEVQVQSAGYGWQVTVKYDGRLLATQWWSNKSVAEDWAERKIAEHAAKGLTIENGRYTS